VIEYWLTVNDVDLPTTHNQPAGILEMAGICVGVGEFELQERGRDSTGHVIDIGQPSSFTVSGRITVSGTQIGECK
jgi:hypothetical protein